MKLIGANLVGQMALPTKPLLDQKLLSKITTHHQKFINIDTGRPVSESLAAKKRNLNRQWKFCGDDTQLFHQLEQHLTKSSKSRPKIPAATKHFIWMRDYGNVAEARCFCCGVNVINVLSAECGHIIAFSKGGSNHPDNLRMICQTCNRAMGNQNMDDFMRKHNYPLKKNKLAKFFKL